MASLELTKLLNDVFHVISKMKRSMSASHAAAGSENVVET